MEDRIKKAINKLGVAERDVIERNSMGSKLITWARLLDEVRGNLDAVIELPSVQSAFDGANRYYENIMKEVESLDVSSGGITNLKSHYDEFARSHLQSLLGIKQDIQALSSDTVNTQQLKKLIKDAKQAQLDFEKSFKENLEKQAGGSQKTLAVYFKRRLKELKTNDATNPGKWMQKRSWWFAILLIVIAIFAVLLIVVFINGWLKDYIIQLTLIKAAAITVLYMQYHFAAKNYHIYADLVAKYEHLAVISETMTDFTAAEFGNEELNTVVYTNAARTLFSEVNTGHLKQVSSEPSVIENFINQIPKSGQ